MLLHELKTPQVQGTYVAVRPTDSTLALIRAWADQHRIVLDDDLHVTVLYSRKPVNVAPCSDEFVATGIGFDTFGDALVLKLNSDALHARHAQFIAQGGTHDYPSYSPHMTLQAKSNLKPADMPEVPFGFIFGNEYTEPLNP